MRSDRLRSRQTVYDIQVSYYKCNFLSSTSVATFFLFLFLFLFLLFRLVYNCLLFTEIFNAVICPIILCFFLLKLYFFSFDRMFSYIWSLLKKKQTSFNVFRTTCQLAISYNLNIYFYFVKLFLSVEVEIKRPLQFLVDFETYKFTIDTMW